MYLLSLLLLQSAFEHVASAARTANRVVQVMQGEAENTEDLEFKKNLTENSTSVQQGGLCEGCVSRRGRMRVVRGCGSE